MGARVKNIYSDTYEQAESPRGDPFRFLDLSGEHLGVRIEEISPDADTSYHHYHASEEEHVLILEGAATLHLGQDEVPLAVGDHVCFEAGCEEPHHIRNSSGAPLKLLVFGERKSDEVVFYPDAKVMLVRADGQQQLYDYEAKEK